MKHLMSLLLATMLQFGVACTPDDEPITPSTTPLGNITLTIGNRTFMATMEQNSTAEAFCAMLPLTLEMQDLHSNEKYHYLNQSLPTNRTKVGTIHAGDIMLYQDNCVVVFYETFSTSYSYSPIGHIADVEDLKNALGSATATIIFTIDNHPNKHQQ